MLIDCHVHLLPPRRLAGLLRWMHRFYPEHPIPTDVTLEECIAHYATVPVDYLFNLVYPLGAGEADELNRFNRELHLAHPWIIPFGGLHIEDGDKGAIVDRCLGEYGFLGFKFHPFVQRFGPRDSRMMEVYERLAAWRRPVVFHTGFEDFYGMSLPPETLEELARRFPTLPLVFAHALFPKFDDAWRLLDRYDNVWLETTNVFGNFWDPGKQLLLEGIGPRSERIMFGTDHPSGAGTLAEIYAGLDRAGLSATVRERLVGGTAERLVRRFWPDFPARLPPRSR